MDEDEKIAAEIKARCSHGDLEAAHCDADEILVTLVRRLGYTETADAWEDVGKWYA